MSTSSKHPSTVRQGAPGASHESSRAPLEVKKPPAVSDNKARSGVSGGGGERDSHHTHDDARK
ncbi:hypothetical protein [Rhizobium leguminosarum]|uniref:hypothetical protein n=1 Tax=Rhizobium leguminosarum TaxID=384 RepID=UPI003D6DF2C0